MREEADSLHLVLTVVGDPAAIKHNHKEFDPSLLQLARIEKAGFLEPFALPNRVDNEIAEHYEPYRALHRETLSRYFDEFVVPKAPAQQP